MNGYFTYFFLRFLMVIPSMNTLKKKSSINRGAYLLDNFQLFSYFNKCFDCLVNLTLCMSGR